MNALIVVNGFYTSAAQENQVARLAEELRLAGVETVVRKNDGPVTTEETFPYDFCVFLDKDVPFAMLLRAKGVRVFNAPEAIALADDKGLTAAVLTGNVKQQPTVFRPKRYRYDAPDERFLRDVGNLLGYPLVAKYSHGSLGEQVSLVRSFGDLARADEEMGESDGVFQAYRAESAGASYRVIVVGGEALGAMQLVNPEDFRSNAHGGGRGTFVRTEERFYRTAETAARALGLEYCGVDLFCDDDVVIEVNGNAYFEEFEKKTGINVAKRYVDYMIKECKS